MLDVGTTCWRTETANRSTLLVDMEPYLAAAKAAMGLATTSIHFLNWAFDPDTILDHAHGDHGDGPAVSIGTFLRDLSEARPELDIRILCWKSPVAVAATQRFFPWRSLKFFAGTRIDFRLDGTLPPGASHHQKVVVVDDAVAFCGSCDIGPDRWDSPQHLHQDPRRAKTAKTTPCYDCRHEVMAMVDGDAASAFGQLFRDRWERATGATLPETDSVADVWPASVEPEFRNIQVGISRTQAPWKDYPEVREGETASLAAIASATTTLYLENQYFTSPIIAEALAQRLIEPDGPEVVIVSTQHSPSWFDQMTMDKTRSAFLRKLEEADLHGRCHAYSPVTSTGTIIIVHAKLSVVDNRFIRVGSSNVNNRSEGFDSECDLTLDGSGAVGPVGQSSVTRFRDHLVAHWLGCGDADVERAIATEGGLGAAIDALRAAGHDRLRPLRSKPHGAFSRFVATHHLGDPISAADSLRPWRRPAQMRHKLAAASHRLMRADVPAPDVPLGGPVETSG